MTSNEMQKKQALGIVPLRLRIGVTGSRHLKNEESLRKQVEIIFSNRWREAFSLEGRKAIAAASATPLALTLVSPLAEGADRLVAQIGLAHPACSLEAVLPFSREEYSKDFETAVSREEFTRLLARAHRVVELDTDASGKNNGLTPEEARREGYYRAGEQVVERCDFLIALWDGQPARGRGGTAEIVELATERGKPVFIISTQSPYEVTLRNAGVLQCGHIERLNAFNRYPLDSTSMQQAIYNEHLCRLLDQSAASIVPEEVKQTIRERLLPRYIRASVIATANQGKYLDAGWFGYLISTGSVAILAIAIVFSHGNLLGSAILYGIELVALATALFWIHRAHHAKVHERWLENRSLAERLRNVFFKVACGIRPSHIQNENQNDPVTNSSEDWGSAALIEVCETLPDLPLPSAQQAAAYAEFVRTCWIQDQIHYHQKSVAGNPSASKLIKRVGTQRMASLCKQMAMLTFLGAISVSFLHVIFSLLHPEGVWVKPLEEVLSVIAITLPAAGASFNGYRSLMEFPRLTASSVAMQHQLRKIDQLCTRIDTPEELHLLLDRTEDLMLIESQDWVRLMRFADLERVA